MSCVSSRRPPRVHASGPRRRADALARRWSRPTAAVQHQLLRWRRRTPQLSPQPRSGRTCHRLTSGNVGPTRFASGRVSAAEMSQHRRFTIDTDVPVYFCDPHSPCNAGRMKTRMACSTSIFRRALNCVFTPQMTYSPRLRSSTAGPGNPRLGHPSTTPRYAPKCQKIAVLRRPLETS